MRIVKEEPALIVGVVTAVIVLLVAFGVPISEDQRAAVVGVTAADDHAGPARPTPRARATRKAAQQSTPKKKATTTTAKKTAASRKGSAASSGSRTSTRKSTPRSTS